VIQRQVRGMLARRFAFRKRAAIIVLQAVMRGKLSRIQVRLLREMLWLRKERIRKKLWESRRQQMIVYHSLEEEMVLRQAVLDKETVSVRAALDAERVLLERAFADWSVRVRPVVLAMPLKAEWAPQMNLITGDVHYLNTRTGETQDEHPNELFVEVAWWMFYLFIFFFFFFFFSR
jgi:hypothetical protein